MTETQAILDNAPSGQVSLSAAAAFAGEQASFGIADLAEAFDITPRAIRFYEAEGLISPERRGQMRLYSRRDVARLAWVLRGKRVGFSLAEIREMLDLYDAGDGRIRQRNTTLEKCRQRLTSLKEQRADLDKVIDELADFCTTIETLELPQKR